MSGRVSRELKRQRDGAAAPADAPPAPLPPVPGFEIDERLDEAALLELARTVKDRLEPPLQSNFRVSSICTFRHEGRRRAVAGANSEPCSLGGAICAERSALVQLRLMVPPPVVECVYIVADSEEPITPGMLCREYMCDCFCTAKTTIVTSGAPSRPLIRSTLGKLYPCPPLLQDVPRSDIVATAERRGARGAAAVDAYFAAQDDTTSKRLSRLFAKLLLRTTADAKAVPLHPVRLAAGALLADGTEVLAAQHQALEYGCSLDPITQLHSQLKGGGGPEFLMVTDQYGNLHPPSGTARAMLVETGWEELRVLVHDAEGAVQAVTASELAPLVPRLTELLGDAPPEGELTSAQRRAAAALNGAD